MSAASGSLRTRAVSLTVVGAGSFAECRYKEHGMRIICAQLGGEPQNHKKL